MYTVDINFTAKTSGQREILFIAICSTTVYLTCV